MTLPNGTDAVSGDILSYQQYNRLKDHWAQADPCANLADPQAGMIAHDTDDDKLYHYLGAAWSEILQTGVPLGADFIIADDIKLLFGTDSDASIEYDETTDDLWKFGVPVSNDALALLQAADVGQDLAAVPAYGHPTLAIYGASYTDYVAMYHDETNAYFRTLDGAFIFQTDEGADTKSTVYVKPKGTSEVSELGLYDTDGLRLLAYTAADRAYIESQGGALGLQVSQVQDIKLWESIASGNPSLEISGWDANAAALDTYSINAGMDAGAGTRLTIGLDEVMRSMVICDYGDIAADFGLAPASTVTLYLFDADYSDYTSFTQSGNTFILNTPTAGAGQRFTASQGHNFQMTGNIADGNAVTFNSDTGDSLTDANAEQAWMYIEPKINQTATAAWSGLHLNPTITGEGDGSTGGVGENTLVQLEGDSVPLWNVCIEKVVKAHDSDLFDAAALTDSVAIFTLPANSILMSCVIKLNTQFAGVTTLKIEVGPNGGDTDGMLLPGAMDLTADAANSEYSNHGALWNNAAGTGGFYYVDSATQLDALATSTVQDLDQTSAGEVTFYFTYMKLVTAT